jgi:D-hexose-6-phosphate mutarotase
MSNFEISGRLAITAGAGGLPKIDVTTDRSRAEIFLHGAHVTRFQKNGEPPLLFMSERSLFASGKAIRGGVPICFPWFGPREGAPAHGFARVVSWDLREAVSTPDGEVKVSFDLPEAVAKSNGMNARASYVVTVGDRLTMELMVANLSPAEFFSFESCLHTYFAAGDIAQVSIAGLKGTTFVDKMDNSARKVESADAIRIEGEVDRVYVNTPDAVEIRDAKWRRVIRVEKSGSASTVVWNPWIAKSKAMPDFGDEEFKQMVCVESGNVAENKIVLGPGKSATLKVVLSSHPA